MGIHTVTQWFNFCSSVYCSVFDFVGALKMAVRRSDEDTPLVAEDVNHLTVRMNRNEGLR